MSPDDCYIRTIDRLEDTVAAKTLAIGDVPEAEPIIGTVHINIGKPKSKDSAIVKIIIRFNS